MAKICTVPVKIEKMARAAEMEVEEVIGGGIRIVHRATKARLGVFYTEEEAQIAINKFVGQGMKDLDAGLPITGAGTPLSQGIVKPQDEMGKIREFITMFQIGPGTFFTPFERLSQAFQRAGKGEVFSEIWQPTQRGRLSVTVEMSDKEKLGLSSLFPKKKKLSKIDKSYQGVLHELDKRARPFTQNERRLATLYGEARTKNEIAKAGGFLSRDMTGVEITLANFLSKLGVAHDIPVMVRRNALIDEFLANKQKFVNNIKKMENAVLEGKLPEEFGPELKILKESIPEEAGFKEVVDAFGLTADEKKGLLVIRSLVEDEKVIVNIPAIYRYATAPKLKAGFKTGADQFASNMEMSPALVQLAKDRMRILDDGFTHFGYSPGVRAQVLGGQLPVFREFIKAGIFPGEEFKKSSNKVLEKWVSVLDGMSEGKSVLTRRVLSGHLNPHEFNPAVTAFKHIRNLAVSKHLDPIVENIIKKDGILQGIGDADSMVGKIFGNYLQEIQGLPTDSFRQLSAMVRTVARFAGKKVDDKIAERLINTLNFATYSASIPFRIALIARNYFQVSLGLPIVGVDDWWHGIETALGRSVESQERAAAMAVKAGALKVNTIPLHGGQEIFSGVQESVFGNLTGDLARAGFAVRELFDKGFSVYRSGDDFGRVAMYHAGRRRVSRHIEQWARSNRSEEVLDRVTALSKAKTFDEVIEGEFKNLLRQDRFEEARDLIGVSLANKVHFLYGDASHPPGWGGVGGKLFGQFGTFPVQYLNHVTESLTRGTKGDRAAFFFGHSAVNLGIVYAGAKVFDLDLETWAFLPSLQYTGGPYAELLLSMVGVVGGSDAERSLALRNIKMMLPWWNRPSIFVPASYFVSDVVRGTQEEEPFRTVARMTGIRFLGDEPDAVTRGFGSVKSGFGWLLEKAGEPF